MDTTQLFVTLAGLGLMGFVAWFFFGAPHRMGPANIGKPNLQQFVNQAKDDHKPQVVAGRRG